MIYIPPFELSVKLEDSCGDSAFLNFYCEGQTSCNVGLLVLLPEKREYTFYVETSSSDIDIYLYKGACAFSSPPCSDFIARAYSGGNTDRVNYAPPSAPCLLWVVWNAYSYSAGDTLKIGVR